VKNINPQRIDHVFITEHFIPLRYGIFTDHYWTDTTGEYLDTVDLPDDILIQEATTRLPSDHYPVMVELEF
jgi:endonuclease/exonuclease/phosphatase family metal-dependent hydrolase